MADDSMRFRNPAGRAGLLNNLVGLINGLTEFFSARIGLLAQESKSALVHIVVLLACLIGALVFVAFGYVFLLVSVIFGIAHAAGISWVWIALAVALMHFVLAAVCGVIARARLTKPMFESTAAELKKDREWLKNLDKQKLPTS
ncbi:MAG: phage holin family protein [Verrucomicrobiota bacterium]|nr:phage holin family protein [Verrucomicrobiota bacterium]